MGESMADEQLIAQLGYEIDHYTADRREFYRRAFITLGFNAIDGDYAEFGCHTGTTFGLAYQEYQKAAKHLSFLPYSCPRMFWALDSFRGLPPARVEEDRHPFFIEGSLSTGVDEFKAACARNGLSASAYKIIEGYYDDTLMGDTSSQTLPQNVALAYIDCDMYSSILAVLKFLLPRIKHGMILAFDDYYCYTSEQVSGARRASVEVFSDNTKWRLVPYVQYAWAGMSYIVESRHLLVDE
jgi:O-methyltransferase